MAITVSIAKRYNSMIRLIHIFPSPGTGNGEVYHTIILLSIYGYKILIRLDDIVFDTVNEYVIYGANAVSEHKSLCELIPPSCILQECRGDKFGRISYINL